LHIIQIVGGVIEDFVDDNASEAVENDSNAARTPINFSRRMKMPP